MGTLSTSARRKARWEGGGWKGRGGEAGMVRAIGEGGRMEVRGSLFLQLLVGVLVRPHRIVRHGRWGGMLEALRSMGIQPVQV